MRSVKESSGGLAGLASLAAKGGALLAPFNLKRFVTVAVSPVPPPPPPPPPPFINTYEVQGIGKEYMIEEGPGDSADTIIVTFQMYIESIVNRLTAEYTECREISDIVTDQLIELEPNVELLFSNNTRSSYSVITELVSLSNQTVASIKSRNKDLRRKLDRALQIWQLKDAFQAFSDYPLPNALTPTSDKTPAYRTELLPLKRVDKPSMRTASVTLAGPKGTDTVAVNQRFASAPGHRLTAGLGVASINNSFRRVTATSDGALSVSEDDQRIRIVSGLFVHPWKMYNIEDRIIFHPGMPLRDQLSRFSFFAGVSFPDPLMNPHLGVALDVVPGVQLMVGKHYFRQNYYEVVNNQIVNSNARYESSGAYFSLTLTPAAALSLLGIFN